MLLSAAAPVAAQTTAAEATETAAPVIGRQLCPDTLTRLTPEALWAMGRIGQPALSPDGATLLYPVTYYSVAQNASRTALYRQPYAPLGGAKGKIRAKVAAAPAPQCLNEGKGSYYAARFLPGDKAGRITFLSAASGSQQLWLMNSDGSDARQISFAASDVSDYLFSPDGRRVILIHDTPNHTAIAAPEADLPQADGMVINDLMYKHWDTYVTTAPHPFLATFDGARVSDSATDLLEGEPYECPMLPFGGIEQLAWSPDGGSIAYTCRKKAGRAYAISTDSDIYLYDLATGTTRNLCKPADYVAPEVDPTRSLEAQAVNRDAQRLHTGYDQNPQFSPCGRYVAWTSMARDGYESDRARLLVYDLTTGEERLVSEQFESGVNEFLWSTDSQSLYFTGVWHGRTQIYRTTLAGQVTQLTDEQCDYALCALAPDGASLLCKRQSMAQADELYTLPLSAKVQKGKTDAPQTAYALTAENESYYRTLPFGEVKERWVKTTDGKDMLCWVVYPPHFDPAKKYPALLFCEGGPQSPVSQFWSYRWNFQIMAANDYIIIAPNRRGLPGFGMEWLEEISGDYAGQCMRDYLSAIDDLCREPYVDAARLGAVGASFGGYSVYWLAGNHHKRFKAFIAHDGIYNTQQQYVETEELWFPNWDLKRAPWHRDKAGRRAAAYEQSPHLYVDRWDTPILCIHGQRDFRIEYTQAQSAFTAARLRGIDAQMLLFPSENHWVLKPQNGILWQRTFFRWLDKYLK